MAISAYFLFRWITDYRKCTISYIECKLRGVKKEDGYLYNTLEPIFDYNKSEYRYLIYLLFIIIIIINFNKFSYYTDRNLNPDNVNALSGIS